MGWLLLIETLFMLFPLCVSIYYGESDWQAFAIAAGATGGCGIVASRSSHPYSTHMGKRDGFLLTAMVWIVFSLFGQIPFLLCSTPFSFSDAFFEAMSGFTTTGASIITSIDEISHGVHLWRAMMQWIGGMGIILFTLAVIPALNYSGGMQMFNAEMTGITHDKIRPRISQTAKVLWQTYLVLTLLLIVLLSIGPMNIFDSVCHALGTVSTGGYSSTGMDVWSGSVYVKSVLIIFMFLGGVNFALIFRCSCGDFAALRRNSVFRSYVAIIGVMLFLFAAGIFVSGEYFDWQSFTIDPLFRIVSTITSTGYTLVDGNAWGPFVLLLTFVLMFSGACAGSTSGGAKIDRILVLIKNSRNELYRCLYPNSIRAVKMNRKAVPPDLIAKVMVFLSVYVLLIIGGGLVLAALGVPVADACFSSLSCLSNTGFGAGTVGLTVSYEVLPVAAKWVLALLMLIGRLELFNILILITPSFWRR